MFDKGSMSKYVEIFLQLESSGLSWHKLCCLFCLWAWDQYNNMHCSGHRFKSKDTRQCVDQLLWSCQAIREEELVWVWLTVGVVYCTSCTLCNLIHGSITSQSAHTDQTSDSGTNMHANVQMWPGMCKSLLYTKPSEHLLHKCVQTCHKHTVGHTIQSRVDQHEK